MKLFTTSLAFSCALIVNPSFSAETKPTGSANETPKQTTENSSVSPSLATEQSVFAEKDPYLAYIEPSKTSVSTLADALAAAYVNNQDLLSARQDLMSKNEKIVEARSGYLPRLQSEIGITGSKSQMSGSGKDTSYSSPSRQNTSSRYGTITLSQNLFAGGSTAASVLSTDQQLRGLWADLLAKEQKTFFDVIRGYLDLINKTSRVDVYKSNLIAMKKSYDTAHEKHKIGEEPLTQVANAEAKLAEAEAKLRSAEAEVVGVRATLAAMIGVEPSNIKKPDAPSGLPQTLAQAISIGIDNNPNVIKAQFDFKASEADIQKINGKYLPSIDLKAQSQRNEQSQRSVYAAGPDQNGNPRQLPNTKYSNNSTNNQVTLSMSYELYSGGQYSSQKRAAHDAAIAKRIVIEAAKTNVAGGIKSAFEAWKASELNIQNYKKQVKSQEVALEATRQEVEVGSKVLLDYLNAQTTLVEAQLRLIDEEKNYFQSAYQMVQLLGGLHAKAMKLSVQYFDSQAHYDNIPLGF